MISAILDPFAEYFKSSSRLNLYLNHYRQFLLILCLGRVSVWPDVASPLPDPDRVYYVKELYILKFFWLLYKGGRRHINLVTYFLHLDSFTSLPYLFLGVRQH